MLVPVVLDDVSYTVGVIRRVNREDFPGGPVVKTRSNAGRAGLIPVQGT